ncbi:NUDIX hydrolase [[Phormidium ambiguum] IAM M-71]|uniref:NUDIX hydrolase n=1 Tax=[Phormidium ambiguum] IAM M-71 TaxID=454136 RepID=A0A1U7IM63_9CYAN|nr:NUDIX hydrolase [Phormidium ambiguum]OKH38295.1 NUDIX hydrolase [Phormidium ambiguum IAM M-71]
MLREGVIRVLALGIIRDRSDRIFLGQGFDSEKGENFYRAMGGGIEFGETSEAALKREFSEEIQAELTNIKYLGCQESIFTFKGKQGHEILFIYECDFVDPKFYHLSSINFHEKNRPKTALWVEIEKFRSGKLKLVPEGFLNYL